jgi:dihydrofolate reductase
MTCFIIAALTADGYIGRNAAHAALWTGKADKRRFIALTKKAGVVVMGQNTWHTLGGKPLKDRHHVIYSPTPLDPLPTGVEVTTKSPQELLRDLEARGFTEVAICGGSQIYTMFMQSALVDRLYLTIEPVIFGDGVRLFKAEMDYTLELVSCVNEEGALLLEYKVKK